MATVEGAGHSLRVAVEASTPSARLAALTGLSRRSVKRSNPVWIRARSLFADSSNPTSDSTFEVAAIQLSLQPSELADEATFTAAAVHRALAHLGGGGGRERERERDRERGEKGERGERKRWQETEDGKR